LILIVAVVVILIAIGVGVAMMQRSRLRPLPDEAKGRYLNSWRAVEARFVDDPHAAVREADQLVVSLLRDRGARMEDGRGLPEDLVKAREASRAGDGETEGMRKAMLHYKHLVEDAVGDTSPQSRASGRKEVA
jgi:hypothetical protein